MFSSAKKTQVSWKHGLLLKQHVLPICQLNSYDLAKQIKEISSFISKFCFQKENGNQVYAKH